MSTENLIKWIAAFFFYHKLDFSSCKQALLLKKWFLTSEKKSFLKIECDGKLVLPVELFLSSLWEKQQDKQKKLCKKLKLLCCALTGCYFISVSSSINLELFSRRNFSFGYFSCRSGGKRDIKFNPEPYYELI